MGFSLLLHCPTAWTPSCLAFDMWNSVFTTMTLEVRHELYYRVDTVIMLLREWRMHTFGNIHSSSSRDRMPTDLGGRAPIKSTHSWLSSNSTRVQSTPSAAYTSCSSLNRCLHHADRSCHFRYTYYLVILPALAVVLRLNACTSGIAVSRACSRACACTTCC